MKSDGKDPRKPRLQEVVAQMSFPDKDVDGAGVGWILASAAQCKPLVCPDGHWVDENEGNAGACMPCQPDRTCTNSESIHGKCGGNINTLECKTCISPGSEDEWCPGGETKTYRDGKCEQTLNGNSFECFDQPWCDEGMVLESYSTTKKGYCNPCPDKYCKKTQFRTGSCSGAEAGYECNWCDEHFPVCSSIMGVRAFVLLAPCLQLPA